MVGRVTPGELRVDLLLVVQLELLELPLEDPQLLAAGLWGTSLEAYRRDMPLFALWLQEQPDGKSLFAVHAGDLNAYFLARHDSSKATGVLGNYVVGRAPLVPLPMTGSATYTGFMSGIAQQGSNPRYAATGSYQNMWDFQHGRGAFTGNFDGRGYSGTIRGTGGTTFAGAFNSTGGGYYRSGSLNGGFFSAPTDLVPNPSPPPEETTGPPDPRELVRTTKPN